MADDPLEPDPEPDPEPFEPPMFGQFPFGWAEGFGWAVPPEPPVDGWVALGLGDGDGLAA